jgi:hypothetical protein
MHEPITVEVGGDPGDGTYRWQNVMFTGRLVQVSESGYTTTSLYEWLEIRLSKPLCVRLCSPEFTESTVESL